MLDSYFPKDVEFKMRQLSLPHVLSGWPQSSPGINRQYQLDHACLYVLTGTHMCKQTSGQTNVLCLCVCPVADSTAPASKPSKMRLFLIHASEPHEAF